ncbi:110 kDa translocon of chloroplast envelope inner membrane [Raphidocelis subcapitata]|uniref:110 kDa translocon of chloroplast envelope inner membrane n=1 Tax=Raphidocelis subcapitata TaxID=307507 RepID=A0A2V0PAR5_9CHLO|nr:110 kDa translocon of chloroplast envelope inner membrane [Raphidocelis subcapitata]|eukprot:GBF94257.1 110 kDa translocon of chloroplast envelope inner membrane [Raphidocelis subcapitata]
MELHRIMAPMGMSSGLRPRPGGVRALAIARPAAARRLPLCGRPGRSRIVVWSAAAPQAPPTDGEDDAGEYEEDYWEEAEEEAPTGPFPAEIPMEPGSAALAAVPLALFYPAVLALAAGAGYVGVAVGAAAPVEPENRAAVGYVLGAAAVGAVIYGGVQAKKVRDRAAVVDLFNLLVGMEEPSDLTPDDVKAVGNKYGINLHKEQLEGLQQVFGQYLEHAVPSGDQQLRGDEAPKILAFKEALGLSDEEAAPVFIEVGRRLSRAGYEIKDRQEQFQQRKAFQRLIYLSYSVFGDQKAAFLLPWRRVFNLNDSQLFVARRDNAREIFNQKLQEEHGGDLPADRTALRELKEYQASVRLMDDVAEESVRTAARAHVERQLAAAVEQLRAPSKSRDMGRFVEEVKSALDYAQKLARLASEEDLVPGVALPTLRGGDWDGEARRRDARELYKAYCDEKVAREGAFTPAIESELKDLSAILCLSAKEAADARSEVAAVLYRRLLREEVTSRRIDAAASPAQVLGDLVGRSGFSPEAALELHKSLYRQKITQLVAKKKLTDADAQDLDRIRRILCIPSDAAKEVMRTTTGRVFEESLSEVLLAGARPLQPSDLDRVDQAIKDLKLDREVAKAVFADAARARLKAYAGQAVKDLKGDKKAAAVGLKRMVQFNSLVLTPLLECVSGTEAAKKELAELMAKAAEAAKKEEDEKKAADAASGAAEQGSSDAEAKPKGEAEAKADGGAEAKADAEPEAPADPEAAAAAAAAAAEAAAEEARRKAEENDPVKRVRKIMAASRGEFGEDEKKAQKEITLVDAVDKTVRAELYKTYLMYSMSGDVVELPVGGVIRKKTNTESRQQDMLRLQHLGDVLGMNQFEVAAVHQDLSEQAFKAQAQEVLRGTGAMSPERAAYLEEMRKQLSLPQDKADKIIREIRTEMVGATAALEEAGGQKWTTERVLEAHKEGIDVKKALEEPARRVLLRREMDKRLGDGRAQFDAKLLLQELPQILGIEQRRVDALVKELVGSRKRMLLVQAVSQHRQKRMGDAVTSLSNLISAYRAIPEKGGVGAVQWGEREELKDLFATYCAKAESQETADELASLFGLSEAERDEARAAAGAAAAAGGKRGADGEDDESWF